MEFLGKYEGQYKPIRNVGMVGNHNFWSRGDVLFTGELVAIGKQDQVCADEGFSYVVPKIHIS